MKRRLCPFCGEMFSELDTIKSISVSGTWKPENFKTTYHCCNCDFHPLSKRNYDKQAKERRETLEKEINHRIIQIINLKKEIFDIQIILGKYKPSD